MRVFASLLLTSLAILTACGRSSSSQNSGPTLAGNWQIAVVLIIAERMGRAIRSPPRDAMLSHAAGQTGLGWGFGLHQALDQTGAVVGPLIVSGVLFLGDDYRAAFAVLLAPALVSM